MLDLYLGTFLLTPKYLTLRVCWFVEPEEISLSLV